MSFLEKNTKVIDSSLAPFIFCYGNAGVGKSTLGHEAPNSIFLDFEDSTKYLTGASVINIRDVDIDKRYKYTIDALDAVCNEKHDRQTIVIDTLDWMERCLIDGFCEKHKAMSYYDSNVKAAAFGAGKKAILMEAQHVLEKLDKINKTRNMTVIVLAHTSTEKIDDAVDGSFNRNVAATQIEDIARMFMEKSDCVLYMKRKIIKSSNSPSGFVEGNGAMFIASSNMGTSSKERLGLPPVIDVPKGKAWQSFISSINTNKE